jgi:hypothetical protein
MHIKLLLIVAPRILVSVLCSASRLHHWEQLFLFARTAHSVVKMWAMQYGYHRILLHGRVTRAGTGLRRQ